MGSCDANAKRAQQSSWTQLYLNLSAQKMCPSVHSYQAIWEGGKKVASRDRPRREERGKNTLFQTKDEVREKKNSI